MSKKEVQQEDSVNELRAYPWVFMRKILNFEPFDAQQQSLEAFLDYRILVLACGRKWGKSLLIAALIVWYAITKPGSRIFIIAPSTRQAKIIWERVDGFLELPKLKGMRQKRVEFPFPRIDLKNGSKVHALGGNSDKFIRGEEADLIVVDEAAYVRDKTITDVLEPMQVVTAGPMVFISTPFGRNLFYQYYMKGQAENQTKYKSFKFPTHTNPFANKEFLEEQKASSSRLKWETEYMAEFMDNEFAVFTWKDVEACMEQYPYKGKGGLIIYPQAPQPNHIYVCGVDWAKVNDYTVASVLDTTKEPWPLVNHYRNRRIPWNYLKADVRGLIDQYAASMSMDATALGGDLLLEEFGDLDAHGYSMGNDKLKQELVMKLARSIEYKRIALPDEPDLIDELKYYEFSLSDTGKAKMEAKKGHDDWVISLALANNIAYTPNDIAWFRTVDLTPSQGGDYESV